MSHQEDYIYSRVPLNGVLLDHRLRTRGCVLGIVSVLVKQYGIEVTPITRRIKKFSAPPLRLTPFMEKLHFAKIPYWK